MTKQEAIEKLTQLFENNDWFFVSTFLRFDIWKHQRNKNFNKTMDEFDDIMYLVDIYKNRFLNNFFINAIIDNANNLCLDSEITDIIDEIEE